MPLLRHSQIRKPDLFTDTLTAAQITAIEATAPNDEAFLGGVLSQLKRMVGGSDWFSSVADAALDPRTLKQLTDDVYFARRLRRRMVFANAVVPVGQSFMVLSVAGSQAPAEVAAVSTGNGAVAALLAGPVGAHSFADVPGLHPMIPKNLCLVRHATSLEPLMSGGRPVFALLQAASGVLDGDAFDDTTKRVQLSFIRPALSANSFEVVPAPDIAGQAVHYAYASRTQAYLLDEQDMSFPDFAVLQSAPGSSLGNVLLSVAGALIYSGDGELVTK